MHNRDMFPPRELLEQYAPVLPVLENTAVDDAFRAREAAAVAAKRAYHLRGRLGMLLVVTSVLFSLAAAFVLPTTLRSFKPLSIAALVVGAIGLAVQLQLLLSGTKRSWLLNRFAAERIRSIKFQGYQFADLSANLADLEHRVTEFYGRELARLNAEVNAGAAALALFSPAVAVARVASGRVASRTVPADPEIGRAGRDAYRDLRLDYQRRFATGEIENLKVLQRIGYGAADLFYVAGAALTVAALVAKLVFTGHHTFEAWIDFLALTCFIFGLAQSIMENASLGETSKGRYENYVRDLEDTAREIIDECVSFTESVFRIERVVLGELAQFCLEASHISYRL